MKIAEAKIDVIEFEVPRISINDARGGMGGKLTASVLRLITESGVEAEHQPSVHSNQHSADAWSA